VTEPSVLLDRGCVYRAVSQSVRLSLFFRRMSFPRWRNYDGTDRVQWRNASFLWRKWPALGVSRGVQRGRRGGENAAKMVFLLLGFGGMKQLNK